METKTEIIETYLDLWKKVDPKMPFVQHLTFLKEQLPLLMDPKEFDKSRQMTSFIIYMEAAVNKMVKDGGTLTISLKPFQMEDLKMPTNDLTCSVEHLYLIKGMLEENDMHYRYDDLQNPTLTVYPNKDGEDNSHSDEETERAIIEELCNVESSDFIEMNNIINQLQKTEQLTAL